MNKTITLTIPWDHSIIKIKVEHGTINHFRSGRCWDALCSNKYVMIHLNRNGVATHAYCYPCFQGTMYSMVYYENKEYGKWIFVEKNKIKEWKLLPELYPKDGR